MDRKELKRAANELKAEFNIGKNGMTQTFVDAVDKYLEVHKLVKIKASVAQDKEAMKFYSKALSEETGSEIIDLKGFTFVLYRE